MESRVPTNPRLVLTLRTEEAYRQLQLVCGMVPTGQGPRDEGKTDVSDSVTVVTRVPRRARHGEFSAEEKHRDSDKTKAARGLSSGIYCAPRRGATFTPTITGIWQRDSGIQGSPDDRSTHDNRSRSVSLGRTPKRCKDSGQRDLCDLQTVNAAPTYTGHHTPSGQVHPASLRYGARFGYGRNLAVTRCSVQVGGNRNCCSVWKNLDGNKTGLPKTLRVLPQTASTSTQAVILSFSAPAGLDRTGRLPGVSSHHNSTVPEQDINREARLPSNRVSQDTVVDQDLPTYDEISRSVLLASHSAPPPGYHELFGGVLPESLNRAHPSRSLSVPRGPAVRTSRKPRTTRRSTRRRCCGRLSDRECWVLVLANGAFILIFILAAFFSK